jgi:hypothetical protein
MKGTNDGNEERTKTVRVQLSEKGGTYEGNVGDKRKRGLDPPHCAGEIGVEGTEGCDAGFKRHSAHGGGDAGARIVVAIARRIMGASAITRQMGIVYSGI